MIPGTFKYFENSVKYTQVVPLIWRGLKNLKLFGAIQWYEMTRCSFDLLPVQMTSPKQ
jgi:hypothetical protein